MLKGYVPSRFPSMKELARSAIMVFLALVVIRLAAMGLLKFLPKAANVPIVGRVLAKEAV